MQALLLNTTLSCISLKNLSCGGIYILHKVEIHKYAPGNLGYIDFSVPALENTQLSYKNYHCAVLTLAE